MKYTRSHLFIDGRWHTPSTSDRITVISPTTEEPVGSAPDSTPADVDAAVSAARRALRAPEWSALEPAERADILRRFADALDRRRKDTAAIVTDENGMPAAISLAAEGSGPVATLRYYADLTEKTPVEMPRVSANGRSTTIVRREPIGVVAAIIPWNFPQSLTMFKLAPALASGSTVVLKPAPETVLDAFQLADAAEEAGLPGGVLNIVTGGREIGAYLVAHPEVNKIAFTGSTAAGRVIGETCGRLLRPVTLELGGKSAAIILDDADLVSVARGLSWASLLNNGQTCYLSSRILAPRSRYRETVDAVAHLASSLVVGDPADLATRVGPLVSERQRRSVEAYIDTGRREGATIAAGGGRPKHLDRGWFVEPTVFADLDNSATVAREEIFGPVLTVLPYDDLDDAVAIANDSEYGLGGTVWTSDPEKGLDLARRIETGSVGVNFFDLDIGAPFGGVKASGLGRELGPEGLDAYVRTKSMYTR
jgi:acyl-CoA reductase-like NAD-dependent aldehyde dehydrogenase